MGDELEFRSLLSAAEGRMSDDANNFTLIRVLAATAVIYGHSFSLSPVCARTCANNVAIYLKLQPHTVAVWVFFVVSGFLVSASWANREELRSFLLSRFLRIVPALFVCSAICALVIGPLYTRGTIGAYFSSWQVYDYVLTNSSTYSTAFALPGVWFSSSSIGTGINGSLWTIAAEVRCYILLALVGSVGLLRNRWLANLTAITLTISAVIWPKAFEIIGLEAHHLELCAFFIAGVVLFHNRDLVPLHWTIAVALILACFAIYQTIGAKAYMHAARVTLVYITIWIAFLPKLKLPFGDYSYGIYLYGFPLQQITASLLPRANPDALSLVAIPAAWIVGALSWHFIEKPALALKPRASERSSVRRKEVLA